MIFNEKIFWKYIFISILIYVNITNFLYLDFYLVTDVASELVYTKMIQETHSWIITNFIPSNELFLTRAGYIIAIINYYFNNLLLSYKIVFIICQCVFGFVVYKYLDSLKIEVTNIYIFLSILWSTNITEIKGTFFLVQYPYLIFYSVVFVILYVYNTNFNKIKIIIITLVVFIFGLSGMKIFAICILPLFIYECIRYTIYRNKIEKFKYAVVLFISNSIGLCIYKFYLTKLIYIKEIPNRFVIDGNTINSLKEQLYNLILANGFPCLYGNSSGLYGIDYMLLIAHIIIISSFIYFFIKYINENRIMTSNICIFLISIVLIFIYATLTKLGMPYVRYYVNIFLCFFIASVYVYQKEVINFKIIKLVPICIIILQMIIMISQFGVTEANKERYNKYQKITKFLEANNYYNVYADYNSAGMFFVYSNGKINVGNIEVVGKNINGEWICDPDLKPYLWLSDKSMYNRNIQHTVLILTDAELENLSKQGKEKLKNYNLKEKISEFNIFTCEEKNLISDYIELPREGSNMIYMDNLLMKTKGTIKNGELLSDMNDNNDDYIVFGPYIDDNSLIFQDSLYDITISYEYLNESEGDVYFDVCTTNKGVIIKKELSKDKKSEKIFNINLKDCKGIEFRVFKKNNVGIKIKNLKIEKKGEKV